MDTIADSRPLPLSLGEPRWSCSLTLYPLFPDREPVLKYLGLDEALANGLHVGEVGDEGAVGTLAVTNPLSQPVLLYEGEEVAGMKQNRVVERTVLVPAHSTLKIPVVCVEQGRWSTPLPC
ncbi:MAG: TIGR02452 family protein, partial [Thermoleophilia bacterium]